MNPSSPIPEHLPDYLTTALLLLDEHGHIQWMNAAAEHLLGTSKRHASQRPLQSIAQLPSSLQQLLRTATNSGQSLVGREISIAAANKNTLIDCAITPVDTNLLVEITDVERPQKIAQENSLLHQQQQSQVLLRAVAHEVLNPLGGIRGAAQLLTQETTDERLLEYSRLIIREADRLSNFVKRLTASNSKPNEQDTSIHSIIDHVVKVLLQDQAAIQFTPDYDPSIPLLYCDRERLIQALINIVANAIRALANTTNATVTIRSRIEPNFTIRGQLHRLACKIQVIDNGPGVDPAIKDTLFFPFITATSGGSGMGLSIAQSLIVQQGGIIECRSHPGHTRFDITLPLPTSHNDSPHSNHNS